MWPITFLSNTCKFQSLLLQNEQYLDLCRSRCLCGSSAVGDFGDVDFNGEDDDDDEDDEYDAFDDESDDDMFALHLIEMETHINV